MYRENLRVRRGALGDEPILRDLRLRALSDAPEAFGSTYERELARTISDWQKWLSPGATFILGTPEENYGIVAAVCDATDPQVVHLMAMWVDPAIRGSGASDDLVAAVVAWAAAEGARVVRLDVMQANERACRLYSRHGFRPTGHEDVSERNGQIQIRKERLITDGMQG